LIIGMLVGLVLRHIFYRRLLLWSIAVWPVCLILGTLLSSFVTREVAAGVAASSIPGIGSAAEFLIYFLQYSLLVLVILGADTMASRAGRKAATIRGTW